jgi:hypothetical protein
MAVVATSTNGNKPKLELALNESVKLKLLKDKCYEGQNSYGPFYLYAVEHDGAEKIIFLTSPIHNAIVEAKLKTGDEFILRKTAVQSGKKLTPQISIEFVERLQAAPIPVTVSTRSAEGSVPAVAGDNLKAIMLQCVKDAADIVRDSGVQLGNDELQRLAVTLFITRSKAA